MTKKSAKKYPWTDEHGAMHFKNVTVQAAPLSLVLYCYDAMQAKIKRRKARAARKNVRQKTSQ